MFLIKGDDSAKTRNPEPEDILKEFMSAMKAGDFEKAYELCDTASMKEYLNEYMEIWEVKSLKDSTAFSSTVEILAGISVEIDKFEEKDGECLVHYTLQMDSNTRKCQAKMKKEEGEWKIAEITNGI